MIKRVKDKATFMVMQWTSKSNAKKTIKITFKNEF